MNTKRPDKQPYSVVGGHVRFAVRVNPNGGRDAIDGWRVDADGRPQLKVRVLAPPEDGRANVALIALMAKRLGVAKSTVRIISGETARLKVLEVAGNTAALSAHLDSLDHLA